MPGTYSIDLVQGARLQKQRQDSTGLIIATATRVALVKGLGSVPSLALAAARKLVEQDVPIGTLYDPTDPTIPGCIATGYESVGVTGEIARIEIQYTTPSFNPQEGQPLIISDDTSEVPDKTQFNPADGTQLVISYVDPNDAQKKIKFYPESNYPSLQRVIVMAGVVSADVLPQYRSVLRSVNDGAWQKYPLGYWRFTRLHTQYTFAAKYLRMTAELKSWVEKDWSAWEFLRDPQTGRIVGVRGNDLKAAQNKPYSYGLIDSHNGFIRVGHFKTNNFPALFGYP